METPTWIQEIIDSSSTGGWFHPFLVTADHPLVTEGWMCFYCEKPFVEGDIATVMPLHDGDNSRWIAGCRPCLLETLGIRERAEDPVGALDQDIEYIEKKIEVAGGGPEHPRNARMAEHLRMLRKARDVLLEREGR